MTRDNATATYTDVLDYPYWRQRVPLDDGKVSPGTKSVDDWDRLDLPESLEGKSFLDIGAFDGMHTFEAERRGATRVTAVDIWEPGGDEEWWSGRVPHRRGIELLRDYLDSDIEIREADVTALDPDEIGTYDVVLCSKVLPFVKEPATAVERLLAVTEERLVLESASPTVQLSEERPYMEYARATTYNDNRWWHPNLACLDAMATDAGAERVDAQRVSNDAGQPDGVQGAVVTEASPVFSRRDQTDRIERLEAGTNVTVVYRDDASARIEYRHEPTDPYRQTWIDVDALSTDVDGEDTGLVGRAISVLREEGVTVLTRKAREHVRRNVRSPDGNNLVHAYK